MKIFLLLLLTLTFNVQAELYKSVAEDGTVTYSDTPTANSTPVTPPQLQSTPAIKLPPKTTPPVPDEKAATTYKVFSIISPENDATIHDNTGSISLKLNIEPELQTSFKHQVAYLLDGKTIATLAASSYTFSNVERGTHTLQARLLDETGKTLKSSAIISVHVKRHSILHKQSRLTPPASGDQSVGSGNTTAQPPPQQTLWPQSAFPESAHQHENQPTWPESAFPLPPSQTNNAL